MIDEIIYILQALGLLAPIQAAVVLTMTIYVYKYFTEKS